MRSIVYFMLIICFSFASQVLAEQSEPSIRLEKVSLQLKWKHQFQFAGYYAAIAKGYYRDGGLEVVLRERAQGSERPVDTVLAGRATYGVEGTHLLTSRLQGSPLVALAAIFQHSSAVAISLQKSSIKTAKDMFGKRVMSYGGTDVELFAMLLHEGIRAESVDWQPMSFSIDSLIRGETDLYSSYLTNEPFFLAQQQIPYSIINPIHYGIDFYGDILFTTEQEITEHPQRVKKFREASLRGWTYALENPEEIVDLILQIYRDDKSREHLLFEARETAKLISPEHVEIGHINPGRFKYMAEVLKDLGRVGQTENLNGFVYTETAASRLSAEELAWLQQKHRVRVFVAHAPPLVFIRDGVIEGLVIDYLNRLTTDFGVQIDFVQSTWVEAVAGVINKSGIDVLPIISSDNELRKAMSLSDPFLSMPSVIFTRENSDFIAGIEDLAGLKVALPRGFLLQSLFKKEHPGIETVLTSTMQEALKLLATGEVNAYIGSLLMTSHIIKEMGLENIKVAAPFPALSPEHVLAARQDWPELVSLFNRTLRQMTSQEQTAIRQRWMSMRYDHGVTQDEIWLWVSSWLTVLLLGFGVFTQWNRSLQREIRRRKVTEEALTSSVLQYQHLVQVLPHGIVELNPEMLVVFCNRPMAEILGYEVKELQGKDFCALIVGDKLPPEVFLKQRQAGERFTFQTQMLDKLQRRHDVRFDLNLGESDIVGNQIVIVTDLTRQQQAENALQESEAFYRNTFENVQAGIIHLTSDGQIVRVNPFMCEMLGYTECEFYNLSLQKMTHADDIFLSQIEMQQLQSQGKGAYSLAKRYLKKNGEPLWVLVTVALHPQQQGDPGVVVVVQDIDEFKHQQDEVADKSENLEEIIDQRTLELQQRVSEVEALNSAMIKLADDLRQSNCDLALQREQLGIANDELEAFAFSVSHDLRAPLRHITGFVSILNETAADQLDDSAQQYLERISTSATKMNQLIDDLLVFSRVGRKELFRASVNMNLLFEEVRSALELGEESRVDWQIKDLPLVWGDVSTLRQVVANLLDNALKYSAKNPQPCIEIDGYRTGNEIVFHVRDNGVGFDPVYADKLFSVFQRLHLAEDFPGTGVGLATAQRIIKRHGGWIKGETMLDQGACFSFALPVKEGGSV